jgi:hypothetical protein
MLSDAKAQEEVEKFMHGLIRRNPGETEFHQAVREVAESLMPFILEHKEYQDNAILERLTEPDRIIIFRVCWQDDHWFRESDILRHIFERVVIAAMGMGLVKGEGFAVDASVMEANVVPIRRVVGPADVAALAARIMSNTALTGATYDLDGGQQPQQLVLPP